MKQDHLVAGTLATDALTAQPAELLSFEWCLEPCLQTGSFTWEVPAFRELNTHCTIDSQAHL